MNSDKAADIRDAINGLPCVAYDPEPHPNYPSDGHTRVTQHGPESLHTGETCKLRDFQFCPAEMRQAGEIGFGDDPTMRPIYEVVLRPLSVPNRPLPTVSIPPSVIHEVAKYGCRIRVEAGYRGEGQPGDIKIRDDLAHDANDDRDGDR